MKNKDYFEVEDNQLLSIRIVPYGMVSLVYIF